jgi:hypothetical protein
MDGEAALAALELRALHAEGEREDIARLHPLHKWLVECLHEGKRVRGRLGQTLPLEEPVLAQVDGSFHLPRRQVEPHRDHQVVAGQQRCVDRLLVCRCQAGQELRVGGGRFSLGDAEDALPLPIDSDLGGNPEVHFKHVVLLSLACSCRSTSWRYNGSLPLPGMFSGG